MNEPFARWPAQVAFSPMELSIVLTALDLGLRHASDAATVRVFRRAEVLIWRKLWPELADQYDDPNPTEEE